MLPDYVAHVMEGRARLRHHAFLDGNALAKAQSLLAAEPDVREARPGNASLLLLMQPGADLAALCAKLEEALPELKNAGPKAVRSVKLSQWKGVSPRRLELRVLTGVSLLCIVSGLLDSGKLHVFTGLAFSALAARHIWTRRTAL
ncbi:hypothetical protein [uncultured Desulfovibrio sp.]|uniref:hypothetical protein n=1 Tax=uncultured Desulfovibrio sp. TaxID=167968 RepID=UPI00261CCAF0|nr:hypothetical protein [uncultured Desulfovibrio sp.]